MTPTFETFPYQSSRPMPGTGDRNSLIDQILKCPIYSSQQYVKPYKEEPSGMFPLKDQEPIIDPIIISP